MKLFPVTPEHRASYKCYIAANVDKYPLAFECWLARHFILGGAAIPLRAEYARELKEMIFYETVKEVECRYQ